MFTLVPVLGNLWVLSIRSPDRFSCQFVWDICVINWKKSMLYIKELALLCITLLQCRFVLCQEDVCDLAIVIDHSGSIRDSNSPGWEENSGLDHWTMMLTFLEQLIVGVDVNPDKTHISAVGFGNNAEVYFKFNSQEQNQGTILPLLRSLNYKGGNTNTTGGLRTTRTQIFTEASGDRTNFRNSILLITDDAPTREVEMLTGEMEEINKQEIKLIAIGLTTKDQKDASIVTYCDYYYNVSSFQNLINIVDNVRPALCTPQPEVPNPPCLNIQRKATILSIDPDYGPVAGKTRIQMNGNFLETGGVQEVYIDLKSLALEFTCDTISVTEDRIVVETPNVEAYESEVVNRSLPIKMKLSGGLTVKTDFFFTYRKNPVLTRVEPLTTIQSGGVPLSITGSSLDSVAYPKMMIMMLYNYTASDTNNTVITNATTFQSSQPCDVQSMQFMECITPRMDIPDAFLEDSADSDDGLLNSEKLTFNLGFILDGVEDYRDLSNSLPDYKIINVYHDPEFGPPKVYPYTDDSSITFEGKNLDAGVRAEHYKVVAGDDQCTNIDLRTNALSCYPPDDKPEPIDESKVDSGQVELYVQIGQHVEHFVGWVEYPNNNLILYIAIPVAIGVGLIIIGSVTAYVVRERGKKASLPPNKPV